MIGLTDTTALQTAIIVGISAALMIALGLLAAFFPQAGARFFGRIESALSRFARRKTLAIAVLFVSVIALRLLALPLLPVPVPGIHDEFSYLMQADTFSHGRLANPPHPMWISFETFHINWFPTYSSMFPPAQGFALALGQLLGHPWIGVLLSAAAMCAAILWMLQGWMPARWAFLGGVLAALKFGLTSYWMNSYWGGAVAAAGGALVLGALVRLARRGRTHDAVILGIGVAILANSRPYEGFVFCIPAAFWFLWWLAGKTKSKIPVQVRVRNALIPVLAVVLLAAAFTGYYNWRVTGKASLLPHVLNTRTYLTTGLFLWDAKQPVRHYRNPQFEDFYNGWARENYDNKWGDVARVTMEKVVRYGLTFFSVAELLLLPALPFVFRERKMRLLLATLFVGALGAVVIIWSNAHYAAPLTCVIFALAVQAFRHVRTMRVRGRPVGLAVSRAVVLLLVLDPAINCFRHVCDPLLWPCQGDPSRAAIAEKLQHTPGKHLILVRYENDNHNIHDEWVYNGADLDGAKVLWARELDAGQNAKLFAYYHDRRIWLVTPDSDNEFLEPYTPPDSAPNSDP